MHFYEKRTVKPYFFLVKDTTHTADNPSRFRRNHLERIAKLMTIVNKIRYEKLQNGLKRQAAKLLALS